MSEPTAARASAPATSPAESPEDAERRWLAETYQPNVRQLTVRAVLSGMAIGAVMCLSNLYVVLKTGWSFGVTITASILGYALFRLLGGLELGGRSLTILENGAIGSVASGAGYMTGGGNMAAIPALLILTGMRPETGWMIAWFAVIAAMGVFAAIPIKRQLVNLEQLPFPTGTATAETLRAMHAHGETAADKTRLLGLAAALGAIVAWFRDAKAAWMPFNLPAHLGLPVMLGGHPLTKWTLAFENSLLMFGGGALMSFKTGWSMLLGAVVTFGVLAPPLVADGVISEVKYSAIMKWAVWPGASMLVASGLLSFAFQWRSVGRAFSGLSALFRGGRSGRADPMAAVECPQWWFPAGFALLTPVIVLLMVHLFGFPWWAGLIAVPLAVVLGVIAARVTGETDTTPTKALGPVTQLVYGAVLPGNLVANVMGANVTGGIGLHAADLLTDLKCGYLIGAKPRQQFFAQLFGVVAGAGVIVPAFNLLVPTADVIGSEAFPAPAAQVWAGVSKILVEGLHALHPSARLAALVGGLVGIGLVLAERWAPKAVKPFVPSASGVGLAMVIPGYNAFSFFLGALVAELLRRYKPALAERTILPVASGFIAGESLLGILIAILAAVGVLGR